MVVVSRSPKALELVRAEPQRFEAILCDLSMPEIDGAATAIPGPAAMAALPPPVQEQLQIEARYATYLARQAAEVRRFQAQEELGLPADLDYRAIPGLSAEVVAVLNGYFQHLADIVVANHGDIDKFVGDSVRLCESMTGG